MKKSYLLIFITLFSAFNAVCQDIYTYINSTAGTPTYVDPLIPSYSPLTAMGTGTTTPCTWGFSGITGFTSLAYTTAGPCIQIMLTASAGNTITSTGFTAGLRRSSTGPDKVRLAYSTNGTTWIDDGIDHVPTNSSCATSTAGTTLASWTSFSVTNPTLYFRIYPFNASGSGGTIQIYGLDIIGNVHPLCTTLPVISVTPAGGAICAGGAGISLTASGAGTGGAYTWTPSTGLSATTGATVTANPGSTITYTISGTTAGLCTNTVTATVTVNPVPTSTVSASGPLAFCPGGSVTLTGSGGGPGYQWFDGATAISGATSISYTATTSGSFRLRITNTFGCSATSSPTVVFVATFPAIAVSPASSSICNGSSVSLTASGAGPGGTYTWSPATGLSGTTGSTVSASPSATTTYTITGANTTGCRGAGTATVTLLPTPPATITASGVTTFCAGGNVTLSAPMGYSYQWLNGSSAIPGATASSYTTGASGSYKVVVSGMGCSATSVTTTVNAVPLPVAVVSAGGPVTFCPGGNVTLNAAFTSGNSYQWYKGVSTLITGATSTSYNVTTAGDYFVYVSSPTGCFNISPAAQVRIVTGPTVSSNFGDAMCAGSGGMLTVNASGATTGLTYQWKLNGVAIAGANSATWYPVATGAYSCDIVIPGTYGCSYATSPLSITVSPAPVPVVTYNGINLATAGVYASYQWYKGTAPLYGGTSSTWHPAADGPYRVKVTNAQGCVGWSDIYNIFTTGVGNFSIGADIAVYPNPASSVLHIDAPFDVSVVVTALDGRMAISAIAAKDVDISALTPGIWVLGIYDADGNRLAVRKFVKE